jgi:hypothetical protein
VAELREAEAPAANFEEHATADYSRRMPSPFAIHPWVLKHIQEEVKYPYR